MSFRRSDGPADRAESERLLDAVRAGRAPGPGADPLARVLAAAAAPGDPGELAGEERALAAFRAARAKPAPVPARAPRRRRLRLGVAAWAAGLAATATAGVAFAAVSLDRPEQPAPPTTPAGTDGSSAASPTGSSPTTGTAGPAPSTGAPATGTGGPGQPAKVQQLTGLCRAYLAQPDPQRATALETPAFADLAAAAGGAEQVEAYCLRLVPDAASPSPRGNPSPGATRPTPAHRTGKPSTDR
ncbi:hypothetical protein Q2K19_29240 [Micromonospora soli]|uniref:hypothetical protein n=1 Tax=Micromonospora sp. NBRC 110009 TaxID=3061627 RepID=UPI0026717049|nr:hypothetical protein [Micromonospora sp. NBRC 110009]WKT98200.1 hypothetical protein Q2K19_29240 [Micromonospora sp. NBRC 110009]